VLLQRLGHHLIEAFDLPVQQLQTFQIQFKDLRMHRFRTSPERFQQFFAAALQAVIP
jgi:hypothetical protein